MMEPERFEELKAKGYSWHGISSADVSLRELSYLSEFFDLLIDYEEGKIYLSEIPRFSKETR